MKKLFIFLVVCLLASVSYADMLVESANVDGDELKVVVSYSGGCEEHTFELNVEVCRLTTPASCRASIQDVSAVPDYCEAFITEELSFNLLEEGLADPLFSNATLTFNADFSNPVTVTLPKSKFLDQTYK